MPTFTPHDGVARAYRLRGEAPGRPLVCLTGEPDDPGAADDPEELARLAGQRPLVTLPGRDANGRPLPAGVVEALRVHLGQERIDLLGHLAGGELAVRYAAVHPDRVRSLVLVTPAGAGPDHSPERARLALGALTAPVTFLERGPEAALARDIAAFLDPAVRTVTVDGVRLAYRVAGAEGGRPVVLVHGRGESATTWGPVMEDLAADHRVYAVDLRGHGLSDRPGGYGFDVFRDELGGFLRALGLFGATVVAHSMGAGAACLLAQREPGLVGRLVLEEPPSFVPLDPPRPVAERPEGRLAFDWQIVPATDAQLNDPDPAWRAGLPAITAPTLVLAGGPAGHVPQDRPAGLAEAVPDARLVTVEAGHLVHGTRPAAFLAAIREFGTG
ncbi:alpha/beta fold hydrolase [Streptomyces hydrogenans]|uniref:alpha/beta fold hydrolase n=1 Tax=Streptomyces hydrogenans TaxID=1873719 RepID=UPI00278BD771|nr:alpha/beta hydrolase [Streptomyces hydrogenans]